MLVITITRLASGFTYKYSENLKENMDKTDKKKRTCRTSREQFGIYLKYLETHPILKHGKMNPASENAININSIWANMVKELNACGSGPSKLLVEWKKVFTEWKSQVRKRARLQKDLSPIETKLIQLTGIVAISGASDVPEIGTGATSGTTQVENEDIIIEVVTNEEEVEDDHNGNEFNEWQDIEDDNQQVAEPEAAAKPQGQKKGSKRMTSGNVLLNEYKGASQQQAEGLTKISEALSEIARSIHRYCDILEANAI